MTDATKKSRSRKPKGPFSDELIDQLLAQVRGKDAVSCDFYKATWSSVYQPR